MCARVGPSHGLFVATQRWELPPCSERSSARLCDRTDGGVHDVLIAVVAHRHDGWWRNVSVVLPQLVLIEVVPRLMCRVRDHVANASAACGVEHRGNVILSHAYVFDVLA